LLPGAHGYCITEEKIGESEKEVSGLQTLIQIDIESGLLSGIVAKAKLRELLDELYDELIEAEPLT